MRWEGGGSPGRGERSWVGGWQSCLSPGFCPRIVSGSKWPGTSSAQSEKSAGAGVKDPQINKLQSWKGRQTQGKGKARFRPRELDFRWVRKGWLEEIPNKNILGLPWWPSSKESLCRCRRCWFHPWVGKILWRRKWEPTPIFLPGESPWTEEPGGLQPRGLQRVRHD